MFDILRPVKGELLPLTGRRISKTIATRRGKGLLGGVSILMPRHLDSLYI
jgi:hypothetical protein